MGRLARAGIYLSATYVGSADGPVAVLRLGTQELVARGLGPADMPEVARVIARGLGGTEAPCDVRPDVEALRRRADAAPPSRTLCDDLKHHRVRTPRSLARRLM